jgi:hypothetical protein
MRILLKVTSSNEYCDGGCEFALVDLTPDLASLALRRIAALREQKILDPNVDEVYYWAYFVACYFSPYASLAIDDQEVEGTCIGLGELLGNLQIEEREVVHVPEIFQVPSSHIAAVECEKMIVCALCDRQHNRCYVVLVEMRPQKSKPAVIEKPSYSNTT